MNKIVRIGSIKPERMRISVDIFCKIEIKDGELSISGVIGPKANGDAWGGCGQIDMEFEHRNPKHNDKRYNEPIKADDITFAPGWDKERWFDFLDIWREWHLNDMTADCEHQRELWDLDTEIETAEFVWSTKYYNMREWAAQGKLTEAGYNAFARISGDVNMAGRMKKETDFIKRLLADDMIEKKNEKIECARWVRYDQHEDGLLCKACPVCGYKYGTSWLKRDLPDSVVEFLGKLPNTDKKPAWV